MNPVFDEQPMSFPTTQVDGSPLKSLPQILIDRRATPHFRPDPVAREYLEAILHLGAQAPSGYNLQPWRFIVVRSAEGRSRLQRAAMDQAKVGEAPVVIIAFAVKGGWKDYMDPIFREGVVRGVGKSEAVEGQEADASKFLDAMPNGVWENRQTMIAFTTMMLLAEAYGLDTAPMEGFDPEAVKREFALPREAHVIALLALGHARPPDKKYGGRLALREFVYDERYGAPWKDEREEHKPKTGGAYASR